jgi:hypothetical protein
MCREQPESMNHLFYKPLFITSESESELELFCEDPPLVMRHNPVKSPSFFLQLAFSSSSKFDESSLEKSKSLKAVHAWDMIFLMFFFLFLKRFFFL